MNPFKANPAPATESSAWDPLYVAELISSGRLGEIAIASDAAANDDADASSRIERRRARRARNARRRGGWLGLFAALVLSFVALPAAAQVPDPGMEIDLQRTAVLITDPQNDFLSPDGVTWGVVGKNVTENGTVKHIEQLMKAAKKQGMPLFISPHYYYPHDHQWKFEGALEALMHGIGMFDRKGPVNVDGLEGSGADWLERYKPLIEDGETIVTSPHKVYGPETNDLVLQLRKRGIDKIILGGMSANLCTESHMRELIEQGFEVAVVTDATAAAQVPEGDGYQAALINFRFIANATWTTREAVRAIRAAR
ncbi:isochorismatase family protein [Elongatibacter sediminis]|uniref:Isochorismatase family protein n=1 Tax=Elongatibacter sediminis TaxID=3119006 RepID=A0AAW9RGM4_9GAMM